MANPYIAGAPLRGESGFFGRRDILSWVEKELKNSATNALVLSGQRRIGKTSLLRQLERTLSGERFLPVYFDLQDQATRPLSQVLQDLASEVAMAAEIEAPEIGIYDQRGASFQKEFLPYLYSSISRRRRPVLLLDEFDVLDVAAEDELSKIAAAKALFPFLRELMAGDSRLAFVFVVGRRADDLSLDIKGTFKSSLGREVWLLDRESAVDLVRQAEENGTLKFTDRAIDEILRLTSGHPYLTQLLCQRIWQRADPRATRSVPTVGRLEVVDAVPDALEAGGPALVWLWNGLSPAEKIYASALAVAATNSETIQEDQIIKVLTDHAPRLRTREVEVAPRKLVKRRVLDEIDQHEYRFAVEILRQWVQTNKPLQEVKDELDRVEPVAEDYFKFGERLYYQAEWEDSASWFRRALEKNPQHFRARLYLGETLLKNGDSRAAVVELEEAYRLDSHEARLPLARALITLAQVEHARGNESSALEAAERALELSPQENSARQLCVAIWTRRGDVALEQKRFSDALRAFGAAGASSKIAHAKLEKRRFVMNRAEAKAKEYEDNSQWGKASDIYRRLIANAVDSDEKASWERKKNACMKEVELERLFDSGLLRIRAREWEEAQGILAELIYRRPNYRKDKSTAAGLLQKAVHREAVGRLRMDSRTWASLAAAFLLVAIGTFSGSGLGPLATTQQELEKASGSSSARSLPVTNPSSKKDDGNSLQDKQEEELPALAVHNSGEIDEVKVLEEDNLLESPAPDGNDLSVDEIRWEEQGGRLIVDVAGSGLFDQSRVRQEKLAGPRYREVIKVIGVSGPFGRIYNVESPLLTRIRTGFHPGTPNELHIVFDLPGPDIKIERIDFDSTGMRLYVSDSASKPG